MDLAIAALGSLLPKLGTLLSDEYKLHKGMRGEIKFMLAEMESMKAALNRVSMLPGHQIDDLVKIWVRDLKELSYDIEDSVDTFMLHVDASVCAEPHSFRRFFDRTVRLLTKAKTHHHIASDIKDIRRRIHEVADRRARYKFEDVIVQPDRTYIDPRLPALYEHAAKLVGIDGPSEELVNILTQRETMLQQNLMVVSIVGVGGLGKTTLANSVYERLGCKFEYQAFVSVSLKPNMKKIFTSMLWQVTKDTSIDVKDKDPQDIIYGIRQFLQDKRYFIVIDDVWDESTWILIRCALTENENNLGSRVIVTTRNAEVAKLCSSCVDGTVYELDPLSEADSKRLFYKRILCDEDGVHSELEEISEKILKKCGGLPLAIITISSLLANKPKSKYEWYAVYNSIGSGLDSNKSMEHVRKILSLSYCDLPSYLKPCLLYLSIFPEDYKIDRGSLVRRWVAEGFIDGKQGRNSYEIGSSYFNELVNRSMIQPINMDASGNARACCVHDMILDLIISLSNEENFVSISNGPELITSPLCKIRRLSLQGSEKYIWEHTSVNSEEKKLVLPVTVNLSHVRSLTAFGDSFKWLPPLSMFPVLRVLDLWSKTLKDLRSLHHLRYLSLGGCLEIPEGIGNLRLLNTLHLKGLYGTIYQLPASVVQLRQLEHLLIPMDMKLPDGIGNMTSLQELSWLNVKNSPHALAELGKLTELRVLSMYGLHNKSHIKTFLHSLSSLGKINTLHFSGRGPCSVHMSDPSQVLPYLQSFDGGETTFDQLPRWFSLLSELSCLSIEVSRLRLDDLQILGALPRLCFLQLKAHLIGTTDERQVIRIKQSFHSLVEFQFMHYRTCWLIFAQRAMPKLQRLQLHFRAEQREGGGIDIGLQNLTSLKQVTINIDCEDARNREVEDMEMRFRDAVNIHLNHPILKLSRSYDYLMRED